MRTLIVFYSRTQTTKSVAEAIAKELKCDMEEIFDTKERRGPIGVSKGRQGCYDEEDDNSEGCRY